MGFNALYAYIAEACLMGAALPFAAAGIAPAITRLKPITRMAIVEAGILLGSLLILLSFAGLTYGFITSDFSILLVADNSHISKPLIYKISGVWGNHEGSMLLFTLIMSAYALGFGRFSTYEYRSTALGMLALLLLGLVVYMVFTSNPLERLFPAPISGSGLNPILQDIGLAMHPPMLYLGYAGFSVVFAMAVAGLCHNAINRQWAAHSLPWIRIALSLLTLGIALGSWWAYRELGWGGYWFWDPVENSSLLPWLSGAALLHMMVVVEKRGVFARWAALLAILTFTLGLMGFFLVRSGLLTSVHSFASDPTRGIALLIYLALASGGAFTIYALRANTIAAGEGQENQRYALASRENAIWVNNLLLMVSTATVLLGTLYPLIVQVLGARSVAVGEPYFNQVVVPMMLAGLMVAAIAPDISWGRALPKHLQKAAWNSALVLLLVGIITVAFSFDIRVAAGLVIAGYLICSTILYCIKARRQKRALSRRQWGMLVAHAGLGVVALGVSLSSGFDREKETLILPGETQEFAGYTLRLEGVNTLLGDNYITSQATVTLALGNTTLATLLPERRMYPIERQETTEAVIHRRYLSDIYVVIGQPEALTDGTVAYAMRFYYRPGVNMLWLGACMVALGIGLSLRGRKST